MDPAEAEPSPPPESEDERTETEPEPKPGVWPGLSDRLKKKFKELMDDDPNIYPLF